MTAKEIAPESTAARVALWRAMHVQIDAAPSVLADDIGLRLLNPSPNWRERPDMHPEGTKGYRASIVGRARLIEDLVSEQEKKGVHQYVILGAGLDTFAQREPELADRLQIFEVDQAGPQTWKKQRLNELGYGLAANLHFVPVNFEAGESWLEQVTKAGFDKSKPAVIASTGVSMYLTKEAIMNTLKQISQLAPGSTLAMTFMLPLELINTEERPQHQMVYERAKASGTPFISFFAPSDITALAKECGFRKASHVSTDDIVKKYFAGRSDGLRPSHGEYFLIAQT